MKREKLVGCRQLRRNCVTKTMVGVYNAREAHLCEAGGNWVTVCEEHGSVCNHETLALAKEHATDPTMWCETCQLNTFNQR